MAYTKINWQDLPSTDTPITADNLQHMDDGIEEAHNLIGSIIASGSNENGSFIKFADGTMICTKTVTGTINFTTEWYSRYLGTLDLGNYAQTFIERPKLNVQFYGSNSQWVVSMNDVDVTHIATITVCKPNQVSNVNAYYDVIAIGKWK